MRYTDAVPRVDDLASAPEDEARAPRWGVSRNVKIATIGASMLIAVLVLAIVVPLISPFEPNQQDLAARLQPPGFVGSDGLRHWFGTDALGRDVMVRVFVGARYSLFISAASVIAMFVLGTTLGLLAGFNGGIVDGILMRLADLQMAFPVVLAAIALVALFGPSFWNIVLVFMVTGWPVFTRTTRGSALALKEREFIDAARALGAGRIRLMFREVLPNVTGPLIVLASYQFAEVILFESSLGFLGLGIQPPTPTWGGMMADGRDYLDAALWIMLFPGLALLFTAAGANRFGNSYDKIISPDQE